MVAATIIGRVGPVVCLVLLVYQIGLMQRYRGYNERIASITYPVSTSKRNSEDAIHAYGGIVPEQSTGKGREEGSQDQEKEQSARKDDIHHSNLGILGLQDWEIKTLEKPFSDSCKTPEGVDRYCCLGTPSHERKIIWKKFNEARTTCDHLTLEDYQWQQQQAQKELAAMVGRKKGDHHDQCDACRIVNLLHQHDLKFAFFGDSVSSQVTNAFACELQRRQYKVSIESLPGLKGGDGFRNFREIRRLTIQSPTWGEHDNNNDTVTLDFIFQYRLPFLYPEQQEIVTSNYDVLIVNFGQHWIYSPNPEDAWERERYNKDTFPGQLKDFFNAIHKTNKVKLLAWRENSAAHFDSDGGEYSLARLKPGFKTGNGTCVPYHDNTPGRAVHAWREKAFHKGIQETNYNLVLAGQHMPPVAKGESELVVIPFYDFSSNSHAFHSKLNGAPDCLHYCYSPFFYLPIWRGIHLSMDRYLSA